MKERCSCGCHKCCKPLIENGSININGHSYLFYQIGRKHCFPLRPLSKNDAVYSGLAISIWSYETALANVAFSGCLSRLLINDECIEEPLNNFLIINGKTLEECFQNGVKAVIEWFKAEADSIAQYFGTPSREQQYFIGRDF